MRAQATGGGALAAAVLAVVAMLVVPLPPALLDVLLAFDIMGAAVVLVVALSIADPLELAAFPSLLLVATLFRLSLDVSATRLILTQGDTAGGAGAVIVAFGEFVMRGNLIVGLLLFVILIVVQLVVVTNGAQRVAEVAARFTLDAMPGKQMAIDADLHGGTIDAATARVRRRAVQAEADFYGAMDGAGKFVRGDAIAAIVIVGVNLIAGIAIGALGRGLDVATAAHTFALLSVGNALATTLPAFLLSTAMGVMVTRASSEGVLGADIARQVLAHPAALRIVGGSMAGLALVPGLPHVAFAALGVAGLVGGSAAARAAERRRRLDDARRRSEQARKPESVVALVGVEQLCLEVGEALLGLLDEPAGSALLARIGKLRRALAVELGIVLPSIVVRDDLRLPERGYAIRVRDRVVETGELAPGRALAVGTPAMISALPGAATVDPVTSGRALWIDPNVGGRAQLADTTIVVDPIGVLTSVLGIVARRHAATLLGRQEVQALLDHVRRTHPAVVKGVVPELASLGLVQRVLQHLVRESISIRDIVAILEAIVDEAETCKEPWAVGEAVRLRLAASICASVADSQRTIRAATLRADMESELARAVVMTERGARLGPQIPTAQWLASRLRAAAAQGDGLAVVVCSQSLRLPLAAFAEANEVQARILGMAEIASGYTVEVTETIGLPI